MKISELVTLIKAGYTKDDIKEMLAIDTSDSPTVPVSDPAPVTEPVTAEPEHPQVQQPAPADNTEVLNAIRDLTHAIQAQNVRSDALEPVRSETAVDILGKLINTQNE